jgi:hypothetical protein
MKTPSAMQYSLYSIVALAALGCDGQDKGLQFASKSKRITAAATYTKQDENAVVKTPAPTPAAAPTPKPDIVYEETPAPTPEPIIDSSFALSVPLDVTLSGGAVWAVTHTGVHRIELDKNRGYPTQKWNIPSNQGNRTYVSEIGLLIGRTNRSDHNGIFVAGPKIKNGFQPILANAELNPKMASESRMCVASFVVGGKSYVGGVYYGADNHRRFVRIPIDTTKDNGVDVSKKEFFDLGATSVTWGYSCFMDQSRNILWSDHSSPRYGVNVATGTLVNPNDAPNASNTFEKAGLTLKPTIRASYSVAGDANGNILSFYSRYAAAHDSSLDLIYVSGKQAIAVHQGSYYMEVAPARCFSATPASCTASDVVTWDFTSLGLKIGPVSSLNDGRIVAITRESNSQVFTIEPKNPNNLSEGPVLTKIAQLNGDAYMYTDFTGATLFAAHVEKTISFLESSSFVAGQPVQNSQLKWEAISGRDEDWVGLKMQLRCFVSTSATKPDFAPFTPAKAGMGKPLPCSGVYDTVEIKVDGDGTSNFSRTKNITIEGQQG